VYYIPAHSWVDTPRFYVASDGPSRGRSCISRSCIFNVPNQHGATTDNWKQPRKERKNEYNVKMARCLSARRISQFADGREACIRQAAQRWRGRQSVVVRSLSCATTAGSGSVSSCCSPSTGARTADADGCCSSFGGGTMTIAVSEL